MSNSSFCFLGDVEEAYENSKKFAENPHVDILKVCRLSSIFITFLTMLTMEALKIGKFENAFILSICGLKIRSTLPRDRKKQLRFGKKISVKSREKL